MKRKYRKMKRTVKPVKYMFRASGLDIKKVEIVRETKTQVIFINWNGSQVRETKLSETSAFFDTFKQAKRHLITKAEREINKAKALIKRKEKEIEKINAKTHENIS